MTREEEIPDLCLDMLQTIAKYDTVKSGFVGKNPEMMSEEKVTYLLDLLLEKGFVKVLYGELYKLDKKGREYLFKKDLL